MLQSINRSITIFGLGWEGPQKYFFFAPSPHICWSVPAVKCFHATWWGKEWVFQRKRTLVLLLWNLHWMKTFSWHKKKRISCAGNPRASNEWIMDSDRSVCGAVVFQMARPLLCPLDLDDQWEPSFLYLPPQSHWCRGRVKKVIRQSTRTWKVEKLSLPSQKFLRDGFL